MLDLLITVPALIVGLPMGLLLGAFIRLETPGPALFIQERMGRNGVPFQVLKFRTMTHRPRPARNGVDRDPDVTALGRFLRRFRIDETPQLLNILRGHMTLVGPRPWVADLVPADAMGRRWRVRPGLTGLSQVCGGVHLSMRRRSRYDALYVDHVSLRLDVMILARTVGVVLLGDKHFVGSPSRKLGLTMHCETGLTNVKTGCHKHLDAHQKTA